MISFTTKIDCENKLKSHSYQILTPSIKFFFKRDELSVRERFFHLYSMILTSETELCMFTHNMYMNWSASNNGKCEVNFVIRCRCPQNMFQLTLKNWLIIDAKVEKKLYMLCNFAFKKLRNHKPPLNRQKHEKAVQQRENQRERGKCLEENHKRSYPYQMRERLIEGIYDSFVEKWQQKWFYIHFPSTRDIITRTTHVKRRIQTLYASKSADFAWNSNN